MRNLDPRTFNIADAGGGADTLAGDSAAPGSDTVAGGGDTVAGGDEGGSGPAPTVFTDWTTEVLTPLLPQGYEVTPEQSERLVQIVNEGKGSPDKIVAGMLNYYTEIASQTAESLAKEYNKTQTEWQEEMRKDSVYGGDKFDDSLRTAKEVGKKLAGDEFLEMLRVTGAGNSVHMLRLLNEVAKYLPKEATPTNGRPSAQPKSLADRMFGDKS